MTPVAPRERIREALAMYVENVQTTIQYLRRSVVEQPAIGGGISKVFSRKIRCPDDHSS